MNRPISHGGAMVVVGDNLIPPPSTPHAVQQTIDVPAASDNELHPHPDANTKKTVHRVTLLIAVAKTRLYHAALNGDWERAESIFDDYPSLAATESITRDQENALHIAAGCKQSAFVEKLIQIMAPIDMTLQNKYGNTALCFAATSGVINIAKLIVEKNRDLPLICGFGNVTPLFMAITYKHREMVSYLLSVTDLDQLKSQDQIELLIATIHSGFYDISLEILKKNPNLAAMRDTKNNNETALHVLARKPSAISNKDEINIWKKCLKSCIKGIYDEDVMKTLARKLVEVLWRHVLLDLPENEDMLEFIKHPTKLLHDAARAGNVEFLIILIHRYPDIVWEEDDDGKSILHVAVENRLENVFNLIHEISGLRDFSTKYRTTIKENYNMLHLAAKLAASNHLNRVSGAALQMQRELLWFKEVEKIVLPSQLEAKCGDPRKLTPRQLFSEEHKNLRRDGEEWMKNTANSCMLVATLIATVVFAASFTVPGGIDNDTGTPIFQQNLWLTIFVISDAAALVSSSSSILMFLSILTSRYTEDDFLYSLPSGLLFGLASLFISIVCMVIAFSATFFILYHESANIWVPATIAGMAIIPVSCFCILQFKLWVDTFQNTYLSRFLFKPSRHKLFPSSASQLVDLSRELRPNLLTRRIGMKINRDEINPNRNVIPLMRFFRNCVCNRK